MHVSDSLNIIILYFFTISYVIFIVYFSRILTISPPLTTHFYRRINCE